MVDHRQMKLRNNAVGRLLYLRKWSPGICCPSYPKRDRCQLLRMLGTHALELSPSMPLRPQAERQTPCCFLTRPVSVSWEAQALPSLRGIHSPHQHLSLSASGAIIFYPARNKQTPASRRRWQADMVPILPSCERASGHGYGFKPGKKIRSTGALRFPLLSSHIICLFPWEERNFSSTEQ